MSNVSIFEKKWIDLVFEGKNKEYGAYQLRQENPKTTAKAFFFAIFSISLFSGMIMLLSSFKTKPETDSSPIIDCPIVVVDVVYPPKEKEPVEPVVESKKTEAAPVEVPENKTLVVAPTDKSNTDVATNDELKNRNQSDTGDPGTSSGNTTTSTGNGPDVSENETKAPVGPVVAAVLDAQPEFPGGMKKFYQYISDNFEKQDIEDVESVTVVVSFVIEKDGSISDIKILRNPGYGLDREAVRVLKSLKTKWKPGILNGELVRTLYTLPVKVKTN